jgi:hypothetical protein
MKFILINGKLHQLSTRCFEFKERIAKDYARYGERAKMADLNEGIDWKACSHAMRAIKQTEELYSTGFIKFPLQSRELLLKIKSGNILWKDLEPMIVTGLDELKTAERCEKIKSYIYDSEFVNSVVIESVTEKGGN